MCSAKLGDAEYINSVHDWIIKSRTPGKIPPKWDDELIWQRGIYADAKLQFEVSGRTARSLEELGFIFEAPSQSVDEPGALRILVKYYWTDTRYTLATLAACQESCPHHPVDGAMPRTLKLCICTK